MYLSDSVSRLNEHKGENILTSGAKILIVEDEAITAMGMEHVLTSCGYSVVGTAARCEEALDICNETNPDLILMDINIEGNHDGIATCRHIKKLYDIPVMYMTAYSTEEIKKRALETKPEQYLTKPIRPKQLCNILHTFFNTSPISAIET